MITYASVSEHGNRKVNEDSVLTCTNGSECLFVLCDGLGGHGGGEIASALTVEQSKKVFENSTDPGLVLAESITKANKALLDLQMQHNKPNAYKTTITMLRINETLFEMAHCGDSRIYTFHKHKLLERTFDHSVPQMLYAQGEISEKQIRFHEDRNRLIRVLGIDETAKFIQTQPMSAQKGMSFLMCSDGFWEWIVEKDMIKTLKSSKTPDAWLAQMLSIVKKNGQNQDMDNISAIAVFIR